MKPAVVFHLNADLQAPGNIRDKYLVGWSIFPSDTLLSTSGLSRSPPKGKGRTKLIALAVSGEWLTEEYINCNNESPQPFIWTKRAEDIINKVCRCKAVLETLR